MVSSTDRDLIGKKFEDFIFNEDIEIHKTACLQLQEGIQTNHEVNLLSQTGNVIPAIISAVPRCVDRDFNGVIFSLTNLTERKYIEENVRYREAFENELVQLSTEFVNLSLSEIEKAFNNALERIGTFCKVDRAYIFQFDEQVVSMSNTHEWCAESVKPEKENLQDLPCEIFPKWMETIRSLNDLYIPLVKDLSEEWQQEKEILEPQGIQSLAVVPIAYSHRLLGFVGFDSVGSQQVWEVEEIHLLRILGDLFAGAIIRQQAEKELHITNSQLQDRWRMHSK